jgi:hypothetical protein
VIQEPTQLTPTPGARPGSRRSSAIKIGLIVTAMILLAIPVVMAMSATSPTMTPDKVLAAGASPSPATTAKPDGVKGQDRLRGDLGRKGPGRGPITITDLDGSQVSLATDDGWTRTVTAAAGTAITKGGVTIAVGDLKVGDEVRFRETRNDDGSYTITAIVVATPKASGEVTKVDGDDITIKGRDGTTRVITVTGSTVYKLGPATGSKSDVKVGTTLAVKGTISGDTFTAISVNIKLALAGGEVTKVDGSDITIKGRDGTTTVIHVTGSTTYKVRGHNPASLSDIAVGERVNAKGTRRADGSLDATSVNAGPLHRVKTPGAPASIQP